MLKRTIKKLLNLEDESNSWKKHERFIRIGNNCRLENFQIEIRNPVEGHIYLEIGEGSIVSGKFVFESANSVTVIGSDTFIGGGLFICLDKITIGSNVMVSWGCTVIDNDAHSIKSSERRDDVRNWKKGIDEGQPWKYKDWSKIIASAVTIQDQAWIGFNCIILKGVEIGHSSIIGAGSVVTKSIADHTLAAGNPAKEIKPTI